MRHSRLVLTAVLLTLFLHTGCDSRTANRPDPIRAAPNGNIGAADATRPGAPIFLPNDKAASPQSPGAGGEGGEPQRWLDLGQVAPLPLAIQPQGRRGLVTVDSYLSVLYDLQSHEELRTWDHRFCSATFSSDGKRFVTVDTGVAVWDAGRGEQICRIEGGMPPKQDPAFYPWETKALLNENGSLVAISNTRGAFARRLPHSVLLFEVETGRLRKTFANGLASAYGPLGFAENGTRLVTSSLQWRPIGRRGSKPGVVSGAALWNTQNGELLREFPDGADAVVSRDGRWIATACLTSGWSDRLPPNADTSSVTIWDARTGEPLQTLKHEECLRDFAFAPDSKRILVAAQIRTQQGQSTGLEGRIVEWDWQSARKLFVEDSAKRFARVLYSPDGRRRFALTEEVNQLDDSEYRFRGWDVKSGAELPIGDYRVFTNLVGEVFFFAEADRFIKPWPDFFAEIDTLSGKTVRELPPRRPAARNPSFAPDGQRILVSSGGNRFINLATGEVRMWDLHAYCTTARFVANGRLAFAHARKNLYLLDPVSDAIVWQFPLEIPPIDLAVSPDGRRVAAALEFDRRFRDLPPQVVLIDTLSPHGLKFLERSAMAFSYHADGRRFVEAAPDQVHECDAESGRQIRSLFRLPGRTLDICCSCDGKQVLACGVAGHADPGESFDAEDQGWVMLWGEDRGDPLRLEGHTAPVVSAAFGPEGLRCATGSLDRTIRLWDTSSGELLHTFRGHLGEVRGISYSPKGDRILSAAEDGAAVWNVAPYAPVPVESAPLAQVFTIRQTAETWASSFGVIRGREFPVEHGLSKYLPESASDQRRDEWTAVLFGRGTFRDLPEDIAHVLSKPAKTVHSKLPLPPSRTQRFGQGYHLIDSADGGNRRLYSSWSEKTAILADASDEILRKWATPPIRSGCLALSPSGDEVVVVQEEETEPRKYRFIFEDALTGARLRDFVFEDSRVIGWIDVGPLGETLLLRMAQSDVVLLDYHQGENLGEISRPTRLALDAQYSPDGRFIAVKFGRQVTLYDRATLAECKQLVHPLLVKWCRFSPDGTRLVAGQISEILTMWDVDSTRPLWTRQGYAAESTVFSRDGARFVSQERAGPSFLWDAADGRMIAVVIGPSGFPALSPDGRSLHLGSPEGPMIWSDR